MLFFGTGTLAKHLIHQTLLYEDIYTFKIEGFLDNDTTKENMTLYDAPIMLPSTFFSNNPTYSKPIVVASSYYDEISEQLRSYELQEGTDFVHFSVWKSEVDRSIAQLKVQRAEKVCLIIGANDTYQRGWIPTNQNFLDVLNGDDWNILLQGRKVDALVAEHVWEHLTLADGIHAAKLCNQYLHEGSVLRIAVPDGNHPNPIYQEWVKPNGVGNGDDHRMLYTHETLTKVFKEAGFRDIKKLEYFDENSKFHGKTIEDRNGYIRRTSKNDPRNFDGKLRYTSLVIEGVK